MARVSTRVVRHPKLDGKTPIEKCRFIPKIFGRFKSKDWTRKDAKVVKEILERLSEFQGSPKTQSSFFYDELYKHGTTYNKVACFSRSPKFWDKFSHVVDVCITPRFCQMCDSCWVHKTTPLCYLCEHAHPEEAAKLKHAILSEKIKASWTAEYKAQRKARSLAKNGVDHPMKLKEVKARRVQTLRKLRGADWQKQLIATKNATVKRKYGVDCVLELDWVREKAKKTLLSELGVDHQMKDLATFQKAMKRSRHIYTGRIAGRRFKVQGKSEIQVARILCERFGATNVHSQFHDEYPRTVYSELRTFPDFFIASREIFVECKSTWTFMGRGLERTSYSEGSLAKNKQKALAVEQSGNAMRWIIHHINKKTKTHHFLTMPKNWHHLPDTKIRILVNNFVKEN